MSGFSLSAQLPALQVVIPLIAAPLAFIIRREGLIWAFCTAVAWLTFAVSWSLLGQVQAEGTISYAMGGWAAPWGIQYRIDIVNAYVALIVSGIAAVVLPYARRSVLKEIRDDRIPAFYSLLLLCLTGLLGMTVTGDCLQRVRLPRDLVALVVRADQPGRDRRALTAAFQYLVMGTIGGTFILIGIGLLYMMTGTLNMADMAERLPAVIGRARCSRPSRSSRRDRPQAGAVPASHLVAQRLHLRPVRGHGVPRGDGDQGRCLRPAPFRLHDLRREVDFRAICPGRDLDRARADRDPRRLAVAIFQENVKRMLAYSSVAQIGYMVLGIGSPRRRPDRRSSCTCSTMPDERRAVPGDGLPVLLARVVQIDDLGGIGRRMPWTMAPSSSAVSA